MVIVGVILLLLGTLNGGKTASSVLEFIEGPYCPNHDQHDLLGSFKNWNLDSCTNACAETKLCTAMYFFRLKNGVGVCHLLRHFDGFKTCHSQQKSTIQVKRSSSADALISTWNTLWIVTGVCAGAALPSRSNPSLPMQEQQQNPQRNPGCQFQNTHSLIHLSGIVSPLAKGTDAMYLSSKTLPITAYDMLEDEGMETLRDSVFIETISSMPIQEQEQINEYAEVNIEEAE
eukprot:gene8841-1201_t